MTDSDNDFVGVRIQFDKNNGGIGENVIQSMPDADMKTYLLEMGASNEVQGPDGSWPGLGTVTTLRVDPGDQQGALGTFDATTFAASEVQIDFISLTDGSATRTAIT